ncbi:CRISPR-associated helicase Cas3' [Streptomyces sp. LP05-1]|uniref:CRISPR-associated helicase Cas3 n=1 Tax=Streptomyces pyxinae TaxID=2970734 RepID=A0ABT2CP29_9ACTN|nr:CRISPR-associated helicase Cas3' [Streptomyces sp. LP05-1]MCS0639185.1 CRISPR-associated helicase Cas3' [Streptomyces sp. LP05-1]
MNSASAEGPARRPVRVLTDVRAKSEPRSDPERLTTHSRTVHDTVAQIEERVGSAGVLVAEPYFWERVRRAALLHDAGKVAEGFQNQLRPGARPWGQRHEVLSLAYLDLLASAAGWGDEDRLLIGSLVATHHRSLHGSTGRTLSDLYNPHTDWDEAFTATSDGAGGTEVQVPRGVHREWVAWLAGALGTDPPQPPPDAPNLAARARRELEYLLDAWRRPVKARRGLLAVLAQGALTLADHAGSAHVRLQRHMPLPPDYTARLPFPLHAHQRRAAEADGHLVLVSPTGSGKTEGGLAWAARQLESMPGLPRLVWTLPYRASLNAIRLRFRRELAPEPGKRAADIGLLHGTVAHVLLTEAVEEDCAAGREGASATQARRSRVRADAMRLFTQRMRVATPHQLLRAAIAGPAYSSVLLEQANSLFVMDELHAYDPETFGRICAAMGLWERLGSRVAVLSATLARPVRELIDNSLEAPVTTVRAEPGTGPVRHRLVLDDSALTAPGSVERLRDWLADGHSVLAVTNTVARAQALYGELAEEARAASPDDPCAALLLHSRFRNRDRDAIEKELLRRHPEREPGETGRRGGLVVATQAVEVSLQLDFDRGAVECAPVEAVAQRAGRVNRRGRHPEGPVEFRVHAQTEHLPYAREAMETAWSALGQLVGAGADTLSEQDIDRLLELAYDTPWGKKWERAARVARDGFAAEFLTFTDPFHDRTEFADRLSERFDTVEVLHHEDVEEYRSLARGKQGDPLLASGLLIPLRWSQLRQYDAVFDRSLRVQVVRGVYDRDTGLRPGAASPALVPETVL